MTVITDIFKKEFHKNSIIPKALKRGANIKLKHYSTFEPLANTVTEIEGNRIIMNLPQKLLDNNVFTGDSVVCTHYNGETVYTLSGEVEEITLMFPQKLIIKVENVEKSKNLRKQDRYPVSLSANVRKADSREVHFAVIKNISLLGVSFTCNVELEVSSEVILNMAVSEESIITFTGRIIRARELTNFYEYGVIQSDIDELNREELEKYIERLKREELEQSQE